MQGEAISTARLYAMRLLLPAVGGLLAMLALLALLMHAQGQSTPPVGSSTAQKEAATKTGPRILAVATPPLADESLPEGGLILAILSASFSKGGASIEVRWTSDPLTPQALTDPKVDVSLPVESADCDRPNQLVQSSAMLCDAAVYSEPLLQVVLGLFSLANGTFKFDTDESILGKTVCVFRDHDLSVLNANGRNWASYKRVTVLRRPTILDCVATVQARDADAFVATDLEGTFLLRKLGLAQFYTMQARPLATRGVHAVVARQHQNGAELLNVLNQGLKKLKEGDAYATLVQKHLVTVTSPPVPVPVQTRRKDAPTATQPPPKIAAPSTVSTPPKASSPPPVLDPSKRELALKYLKRGNEELAEGRVAPARLLFERAAEMGLAQAAMALAATYDPAELKQPHLLTVLPDPAEARRWYERAHALGAAEASARLLRLGAVGGGG